MADVRNMGYIDMICQNVILKKNKRKKDDSLGTIRKKT